MNKLNGWMRLWVFVSLPWIASVIYLEFDTFTHSPHEYTTETQGTVIWDDEITSKGPWVFENEKPESSNGITIQWDDDAKPWEKYGTLIETKESPFWANLFRVSKIALTFPAVLFGLGYGIAWVRRGFKKTN